jgi:hypothetical protein
MLVCHKTIAGRQIIELWEQRYNHRLFPFSIFKWLKVGVEIIDLSTEEFFYTKYVTHFPFNSLKWNIIFVNDDHHIRTSVVFYRLIYNTIYRTIIIKYKRNKSMLKCTQSMLYNRKNISTDTIDVLTVQM